MTPVDVNTAKVKELDAIPQPKGHGLEILRYRAGRRVFTALRHAKKVPGMAGNAHRLEDFLAIEPGRYGRG